MCQHVLLLEKGEVLAQGNAEKVADEYLKRAKTRGNERLSLANRGPSAYPRWGTGEIETLEVELLDGSGAPTLVFQTNEPFQVRLRYKVLRDVRQPVFGLGIYRSDGTYVNGSNHHWREHPIGIELARAGEQGELLMSFEHMPLLQGAYYLTTFLYDHSKAAPTAIDHREHALSFEVLDARRLQHGMLYLPTRWQIVRRHDGPRGALGVQLVSKLYDLPFDQFQRYKLVSTLVEELRGKGESLEILDVGGRTALLRQFLKQDHDHAGRPRGLGEKGPRARRRRCAALPRRELRSRVRLRHARARAAARAARASCASARAWRGAGSCWPGPTSPRRSRRPSSCCSSFLQQKLGVRHRYLEEHRHHGLPDREATEKQFEKLGARVVSLGHGNVQRWLALISMALYMDHTPALQSLAVRLHRFYNRGLFGEDEEPPVYRHALVAALGDARLPKPHPVRAEARPPARELLHFAQELAAFDAQRDGHQAEFERLQSVIRELQADLAGHKQSLLEALERRAEAQRVVHDLATDLAGHQQSLKELRGRQAESVAVIATLRSDLEGHRRSLQEALARGSEAESVARTLQYDLDGHRRSLEQLRELRTESEQVIATLQQDLEGHRGTLQELSQSVARYEGLIAEHRALIGERERELELHARVLEELRGSVASLEAEKTKLLGLRERERREYDSVRAELEREIGALHAQRSELKRELTAREAHARQLEELRQREHGEHALLAQAWQRERGEFEAVVAARDAELRRHGELQQELRRELEEHRAVLGERERELAEYRQVTADLRADLAGHRALVAGQQQLLAQRETEIAQAQAGQARTQAQLAHTQAEQARTQAELAHAREQLADLRAALERARGEINVAAGALEEKERLIGLLRAELKSRLRSLRRALGPARPTAGE